MLWRQLKTRNIPVAKIKMQATPELFTEELVGLNTDTDIDLIRWIC